MVIVYKRYSFKEPAPITSDQFLHLKQQIAANAGFEINGDFKTTFTSHYKKNFRWFLIGLVAGVGSFLLYQAFFYFVRGRFGWPEYLAGGIIVAGGLTALFMLMRILLEGPSMATFLTERKQYFIRMKHTIRDCSDYSAFYTSFYGDGKKNQAALEEYMQSPASVDRFLTRSFYLIDQHFWKLILVAGAIFLIRKYMFTSHSPG